MVALNFQNAFSNPKIDLQSVIIFVRQIHNYHDNSGKKYYHHTEEVALNILPIFQENIGSELKQLNLENKFIALLHDFKEDYKKLFNKNHKQDNFTVNFLEKEFTFERKPDEDFDIYFGDKLREVGFGEYVIHGIDKLTKKDTQRIKELKEEIKPLKDKGDIEKPEDIIKYKEKQTELEELKSKNYNKYITKKCDLLKNSLEELKDNPSDLDTALKFCLNFSTLVIKLKDNHSNLRDDRNRAESDIKGNSNSRLQRYQDSSKQITECLTEALNCFKKFKMCKLPFGLDFDRIENQMKQHLSFSLTIINEVEKTTALTKKALALQSFLGTT